MKKTITRAEWSTLILFLAILLGTFLRFNPTMLAGFAINDGGMFAVMVNDLKNSHYLLPAFTTYNHLNIPFAYPPLGFYLGRLAADVFGFGATGAVRWVPAFFASLSIPAFYWLALRVLKNKYYAAVSALFFALMPRAFFWFVMGGGLTRGPGQFFMLLALAAIVRLYEEHRRVDIFWAGLFSGLAVMSYPEAAVHTALSAVFLWLMLSRKRATFINSIGVAIVVLIVTAPWWATVIHYHGISPLLSAAATGQKALSVFHLLFFSFTEEPYATFIAVLGLIGIGYRLLRRDYLLPLWMAFPFLLEGRSAPGPAAIALAMLAAVGLIDVILPAIQKSFGKEKDNADAVPSAERNVFIYLALYLTFSAYQFGFQLSGATLYPPDQEAMAWIGENVPANSRFLVLTGTTSVACDSVLEWFPALTGRQSIFTVQGREWTEGKNFNNYILSTYPAQRCLSSEDASCLDSSVSPDSYDYIYLSKTLRANNCAQLDMPRTFPYFVQSMRQNNELSIVYETEDVIVWKKK
ncbi:MAG: glycosyltransferase family 39 protein [Anaerolineales bacterium]